MEGGAERDARLGRVWPMLVVLKLDEEDPRSWKKQGKGFSSTGSTKRAQPCDSLTSAQGDLCQTSNPQNCKVKSCCFKSCVCGD